MSTRMTDFQGQPPTYWYGFYSRKEVNAELGDGASPRMCPKGFLSILLNLGFGMCLCRGDLSLSSSERISTCSLILGFWSTAWILVLYHARGYWCSTNLPWLIPNATQPDLKPRWFGALQLSLGICRGLVPWPPADTKIHGCSSSLYKMV